MAAEAGYFPDLLGEVNAGTNKGEAADFAARLLEALGEDASGRKVYAEGDGPDTDLMALSDALSERGIDLAAMSNDEAAAALEDDVTGVVYGQDDEQIRRSPIEAGRTDVAPELRRASGGRAPLRSGDRIDALAVFGPETETPVYEIADPAAFRQALTDAVATLGPQSAQVTVYDDYAGMRQFLFNDGKSGFALRGGDIVSVFSSADAPPGAVARILPLATMQGGNRLDAFNTYLPALYARFGMRAVARLPFNREFAPQGWDMRVLGEPDVVFMVFDPDHASAETDNEVPDYESGVTAQRDAIPGAFDPADPRVLDQEKRGSIVFPAGGVTGGQTIVNLLGSADLSTFIHESGHFFLEAFNALASDPNAPQAMKDDLAAILDWFGVKDWYEVGVEQHEQWARGFESCAMEGKAPSLALADAFARFKAWLTQIYRSLAGINVKITPEIREVMDRMLATDAEVAEARAEMEMRPLFAAAPPGMSDGDFATYRRMARRATETAEQALLEKTMTKVRREKEAWFREEKQATRAEVAVEYDRRPEYRLIDMLANQTWHGLDEDSNARAVPDVQIDRKMLVFYCSDPGCWLGYNAALGAVAAGYTNVYWYRGGLQAWQMSGLPLVPSGF
ncbi:rhodanese-like domain-containing protein [Albidovulum sp.]|uniref:rhodanese-like domain-containing protein n=1 Tax=Albidovulum sp. TaxID=1872424 RepID=UPI0039B8AE36